MKKSDILTIGELQKGDIVVLMDSGGAEPRYPFADTLVAYVDESEVTLVRPFVYFGANYRAPIVSSETYKVYKSFGHLRYKLIGRVK